jgi:hypothetical protein
MRVVEETWGGGYGNLINKERLDHVGRLEFVENLDNSWNI